MSRYLCCEDKKDVQYGTGGCNHDHCTGPVIITNPSINVLLTSIDYCFGKIAGLDTESDKYRGLIRYYREELDKLVEEMKDET